MLQYITIMQQGNSLIPHRRFSRLACATSRQAYCGYSKANTIDLGVSMSV